MADSFLPLDGGGKVGVKGSCPRNLSMRHYTALKTQVGFANDFILEQLFT